MRSLLLLSAIVLAAGCATSGKDLVAQGKLDLDAAPLCCATLAEARRTALPLEAGTVVLDKTAQAFAFGDSKAFFVLYELPEYTKPYSIIIRSAGAGTLDDTSLLIPRVAFYDQAWKPARYFDEKTLRNRGNGLERTVFINPANAGERYMAIFGSDLSASIERAYSMVTVTPVAIGPVIVNVYDGADGTSTLRSSPTGTLGLEIRGLAPKK